MDLESASRDGAGAAAESLVGTGVAVLGVGDGELAGADMLDGLLVSTLGALLPERWAELESADMLDDGDGVDAVEDADAAGVTKPEILSIVFCETPAFDRSEALE